MKKILLSAVLASAAFVVSAQELTEKDLNEIRSSFVRDPQTIALQKSSPTRRTSRSWP